LWGRLFGLNSKVDHLFPQKGADGTAPAFDPSGHDMNVNTPFSPTYGLTYDKDGNALPKPSANDNFTPITSSHQLIYGQANTGTYYDPISGKIE